jgi:hypothetical protein
MTVAVIGQLLRRHVAQRSTSTPVESPIVHRTRQAAASIARCRCRARRRGLSRSALTSRDIRRATATPSSRTFRSVRPSSTSVTRYGTPSSRRGVRTKATAIEHRFRCRDDDWILIVVAATTHLARWPMTQRAKQRIERWFHYRHQPFAAALERHRSFRALRITDELIKRRGAAASLDGPVRRGETSIAE